MTGSKRLETMDIDVNKVAMLARIRLTGAEASHLGPQLGNILGYIDQLSEVDTKGIAPTAHPHDVAMPLRADAVSNGNRREALQRPAPNTESGLYVVPKVIE
jgi:aspartyl-tRNA(Asn)/glutamyl-tRNA(Gln) amidotransferase subunit C